MDPLEDHHLARSTLPSGTRKTFAAKSCTPSARRPPIAPLQTATHRSQEVKPVLSVNPAPHTPLGTFSAYPDRTRDLNVQVPFPNSPASPRTILTPPTDPQIELALRVDATRISLGRYEAEQDLTFSVRVDNSVADDVEVQLVTTKEGTEVVYELKIRKKDPYGLRVRDGIIPYTYVPPFSSVSSSSGWSSICSSPVTTPPLEVPPFHQYGSYFPPQYMSGGSWRTPKRTSTSKGSRSSRSSGSTVRTPTAGSKLNGQTSYFMVGNAPVTPPAGKMMATQISLAQYDSDADDSDDNSSFLDHNASGQGYLVPRLTPAYGVRGCMLQTRSEAAISLHSSHQNDATMACDSNNGLKPITDDYPWLKSHFSDTEVEVETESEEDSSTERVSLVEISS